ncbi:MAG: hypothetical protein Q9O62_01825 [Ardenticatenia bacterium]|nr:hypothetical protein [Ardenticatenia bacterium]
MAMRGLFKQVARQVIESLTVSDLKEIMDDTVNTVLYHMDQDERLDFSYDIITSALRNMLAGLTVEQRRDLLIRILPTILAEFPLDQLGADDLLTAIREAQGRRTSP